MSLTKLIQTAKNVGGESLLGVGEPSFRFQGPPRANYVEIARRTIATLNQGAHIADLGVSDGRAQKLADESGTIGHFLGLLRRDLLQNQLEVDTLLAKEKCRLWVVVCAGNDPDGDIAGLTRGALSAIDIERLMSATNANIIQELKRYPNKLGILGSVLDAKILHLPIVTALAVARAFAGKKLQAEMATRNLSIVKPQDAGTRLAQSELARAFKRTPMGTRTKGKVGSNTEQAFRKLSEIAKNSDQLLNDTLGKALVTGKLIDRFETEKDFGKGLTRFTDIICHDSKDIVRLELMWRSKTGRAEIANYTLTKLYNYGRAIGFLS